MTSILYTIYTSFDEVKQKESEKHGEITDLNAYLLPAMFVWGHEITMFLFFYSKLLPLQERNKVLFHLENLHGV